jgi:predicted DCC family thiol-disulfide oxidoreductase YuxK
MSETNAAYEWGRHGIVRFDGTCLFCHASMRFIAERDRELVYDIVANLRYRIAGTSDSCHIPSDAIRQRMI